MHVKLLDRNAVGSRFDRRELLDRGQRRALDAVGDLRVLHDGAQHRHGSLDAVARLDLDASASDMTARLAAHGDRDLVAQAHRFDSCVEDGAVGARVDEGAQGHVPRDARETIEVRDRHCRVLLIFTDAAAIGRMLSGLLAIRTDTATTLSTSSTRSAILWASASISFADSPSMTSFAIAYTRR